MLRILSDFFFFFVLHNETIINETCQILPQCNQLWTQGTAVVSLVKTEPQRTALQPQVSERITVFC